MALTPRGAASRPPRLRLNPILCDGIRYCAEILPELIRLDDWGYPIVEREPIHDARLQRLARRAVAQCPRVALALTSDEEPRGPLEPAGAAASQLSPPPPPPSSPPS